MARAGAALLLGVCAVAARAAPTAAQALPAAVFRSGEVVASIVATTVNDFTARAAVAGATFSGTALSNVTGVVELRAADLHTGIGLRDRHLRNTMQADSFPTIRFQLDGVDAGAARGDSVSVVFRGTMIIHGVSRAIRAPGLVVLHPGGADISARIPLDMRDYGIAPPSRFFGAVKVNPLLSVAVRLAFGN